MSDPTQISTFFFDYGDTLVENRPRYLERVTSLLGEFGYERKYDEVVSAFTRADYLIYEDICSGALDGAGRYLDFFLDHFARCLEIDIDWKAVLPEITKKFEREKFDRILSDGTLETLEGLKSKGCRLGIISNNDGTCREKCEQMDIDKYFEIIIDSTTVGVGKPSPAIFELALEQMKIGPQEAAHVGDMYGADVMGAHNVGLVPVWYNQRNLEPLGEYRPDYEVGSLTEILDIL